jgi:hypothetical protein
LEHFVKRKKWILDKLNGSHQLLKSKILFIKGVVSEKIIIFNKKKDFIVKQITGIDGIIQVNGNYDYLLDLKIHTLTEEKIVEIEQKILSIEKEITLLTATTIETMWTNELLSLDF